MSWFLPLLFVVLIRLQSNSTHEVVSRSVYPIHASLGVMTGWDYSGRSSYNLPGLVSVEGTEAELNLIAKSGRVHE